MGTIPPNCLLKGLSSPDWEMIFSIKITILLSTFIVIDGHVYFGVREVEYVVVMVSLITKGKIESSKAMKVEHMFVDV